MPPPLSMSTFTAGAVPVVNEKGETTMQKVKVTRYVTGKRPAFAPSDESEDDEFIVEGPRPSRRSPSPEHEWGETSASRRRELRRSSPSLPDDVADPRLQRLRRAQMEASSDEETDRGRARHHRDGRVITEPEIINAADDTVSDQINLQKIRIKNEDDSDEDDEAIDKRRAMIRERAQQRIQEEDISVKIEEENESDEDSEYDECSDSEDELNPRLKPVFIRKEDRVTFKEKEKEARQQAALEVQSKRQAEERRVEARRIVEQEVKKEIQDQLQKKDSELDDGNFEIPVVIDDEDPEAEYEAWKVRELTRLKRDRDERDAHVREQEEMERLRNLTEEERLRELAKNPKQITNKAQKGKMKFLQKYYHRGVYYLDQEEDVFKRDYTAPTLEDHHDKAVLPKVMQVKNFGRAGRTKYTHLVDQDTTKFDSPWTEQSTLNIKYYGGKAAGTKQVFNKPSAKRQKVSS